MGEIKGSRGVVIKGEKGPWIIGYLMDIRRNKIFLNQADNVYIGIVQRVYEG